MYNMRQAGLLLSSQISVWPQKPIFYLGLALNLNFALAPIYNMVTMAGIEGTALQVVEPYLMFSSHSGACFLWAIGLIVFLSDAPFIDERITYVALRTGRKIWTYTQVMYIAATAVVYGLIPLLVSILISLPYGYAGNVWSVMLFRIAENSGGLADQLGLVFPNVQMLSFFTPYQFLAISMTLQMLYCLALGMIVFCFNLIWRKSVGTVVALCAHNLGYFILLDGVFFANQHWSILVHALACYHSIYEVATGYPTFVESVILFSTIAGIMVTICFAHARKIDFSVPYKNV